MAKPPITPYILFSKELDQIRSMYREGKGGRVIAAVMNRGRSGIIYAINAMKKRGEL